MQGHRRAGIRPGIVDNSYVRAAASPTLGCVHWDRLFEDLEGQLASEWEAERAALDAESERLRIARLDLRSRLQTLCAARAAGMLELTGRRTAAVRFEEIGADWIAASVQSERGTSLIPLGAIRGIRLDHGQLLASLEPTTTTASPVRERMTLGFVLRDLARRRVALTIEEHDGAPTHGTIDRAGADHLDLAVHDSGTPRRAQDVRAFRVVPFSGIVRVRIEGDPR